MINSRKIEDLTPEAQIKCRQFLSACSNAGLKILVINTLRDQEFQKSLMHKVEQSLEERSLIAMV